MTGSLLDAAPVPMVLIGANQRIQQINPPAAAASIVSGLVSRHFGTAFRQPTLLDAIEAAFRLGQRTEAPYVTSMANREMTWQASACPVDLPEGRGVLLTFLDTTPLREATAMRRDFVANVSHELRTPLTALLGFIETLKGPARDDAAARDRFLGIMAAEAERMNRLVGDLMSLSRVESQERERPTDAVDVTGLLRSTIQSLAPVAEARSVRLDGDTTPGPVFVAGDRDQLSQVLSNLVENAIKYGGTGGVVTVSVETAENDLSLMAPSVTIRVRDRGPGIDPVHIPRLTERFYRVDSHRSRELGGTGLGLAIVKHIVNRHRGRLKIESQPGEGSLFSVILPLLEAPKPA